MEWLFNILKHSLFIEVCQGDGSLDAREPRPYDKFCRQFLYCLRQSLVDTAAKMGWEYDESSMTETFFDSLAKTGGPYDVNVLNKILENATGYTVTGNTALVFEGAFYERLTDDQKLCSYLVQKRLIKEEKIPALFPYPYILTPNADHWENPDITGRDDITSDLCLKLQTGTPRIQLTGMEGIGKTEILNKIYVDFADYNIIHDFDHIALIEYSGFMANDIVRQIPGAINEELVWPYLRGLCGRSSVLIIINDKRPRQADGEFQPGPDESFSEIFTLRAAILFASPLPMDHFTPCSCQRDVSLDAPLLPEAYSFNEIEKEEERNLLQAFALIFPNQHLSFQKCMQWMREDVGVNEDNFRLLLDKFVESAWLTSHRRINGEGGAVTSYAMPQMVQVAICSQTKIDTESHTHLITRCLDDISRNQYEAFEKAHPFIPYAISIAQNLHDDSPELASLMFWIGRYYSETAGYTNALEWFQKALTACKNLLGGEHPDIATIYDDIAVVYARQGDYPEALKRHRKALAITEKVLGREHPDSAATYNNIAVIYAKQGDYPMALKWHRKALVIREKTLGREHLDTAATYNNIAGVHYNREDYKAALKWYQKALTVYEKVLGEEHPDTAAAYNNLAVVYVRQNNNPGALEQYHKAIAVYEKVLGNKHPVTAAAYNNIAVVYARHGDYPGALEWYQKALAITEKALGSEHPDTATTYNNIAWFYNVLGDYPRALEWYQKALAIREKVLGKEHPDTVATYNSIAEVRSVSSVSRDPSS